MNAFKRIPIWENRRRIQFLQSFLDDYGKYLFYLGNGQDPSIWRRSINRNIDEADKILSEAGQCPVVIYTPPPMVGGNAMRINIVQNIFNLDEFEMAPRTVLDYIERATGVYEHDQTKAWLRTVNPFFWLGLAFDGVARLPFVALGKLGFPQSKIETSPLGRFVRGLLILTEAMAAFLACLYYLGWLDRFKHLLRIK